MSLHTSTDVDQRTQVPALEPGDCLNRYEFERRYNAMPELKKAELIEGIVYMQAAVRSEYHGEPHAELMGLLFTYKSTTPGVRCSDNASIRLNDFNEPQPDGMMFIDPQHGGQVKIVDGYVEGAPEFAAEISTSSVSYDSGPKFRIYERHGVQEYLIWRVQDKVIEVHALQEGHYRLLPPDTDGVIHSKVFPGLRIDTKALLSGDSSQALKTLHAGLATTEHQRFLKHLQAIKK